jgi:hypothetical protein
VGRTPHLQMNNAESLFVSLETTSAVTGLVGKSEDLYFEAKRCKVPLSDTDKDHLAEALSGFANADGGTLVYGLIASGGDRSKPDVVTAVERVKNVPHLLSEILGLVGQVVQPPVEKVQVVARELSGLPGEGFVLVFVPPSGVAPHRSLRTREYYRRHGCGFFRMEHYELAEMFGRRQSPKLRFFAEVVPRSVAREGNEVRCEITVGIENIGRSMAKYPSLRLNCMPYSRPSHFGIDGNGTTGLPMRGTTVNNDCLFGGGADDVIYPGSKLEVTNIRHRVPSMDPAAACFPGFRTTYEICAQDVITIKGEFSISGEDIGLKARA